MAIPFSVASLLTAWIAKCFGSRAYAYHTSLVGKSSSRVQEFADLRRSLGSFLITLPRKSMPLKTKIKMPGVTVKAINAIQLG